MRKGFTLIELLVVIAIIAILAAILFPVFAKARAKAMQAACLSNVKQLVLGHLQYANDWDQRFVPPSIPRVPSGTIYWPFLIQDYIQTVDLYYCPISKLPITSNATNIWRQGSYQYYRDAYDASDPAEALKYDGGIDDVLPFAGSPWLYFRQVEKCDAARVPLISDTFGVGGNPNYAQLWFTIQGYMNRTSWNQGLTQHDAKANVGFVDGHAKAIPWWEFHKPAGTVNVGNGVIAGGTWGIKPFPYDSNADGVQEPANPGGAWDPVMWTALFPLTATQVTTLWTVETPLRFIRQNP